jgi:hypothetical protein
MGFTGLFVCNMLLDDCFTSTDMLPRICLAAAAIKAATSVPLPISSMLYPQFLFIKRLSIRSMAAEHTMASEQLLLELAA